MALDTTAVQSHDSRYGGLDGVSAVAGSSPVSPNRGIELGTASAGRQGQAGERRSLGWEVETPVGKEGL